MSFESGGGQRFPYTYAQVFSGLLKTLPENGFKVKLHDKDIGRIECSAGMSLFSYGENIAITVEEIDGYSTRLNIQSGLKLQGTRQAIFTGEGKNAKNVSLIITALTNYLKTQKKPERPRPIPQSATPPPPPIKTVSYYIYLNDQVKGPFSQAQIKALLQVDSATPATPCCPEGSEEWQTIGDLIT
jgi:hypothetical protein